LTETLTATWSFGTANGANVPDGAIGASTVTLVEVDGYEGLMFATADAPLALVKITVGAEKSAPVIVTYCPLIIGIAGIDEIVGASVVLLPPDAPPPPHAVTDIATTIGITNISSIFFKSNLSLE
jgi:hypothetical protein